jgi:hypothetical protein
MGLSFVGKLPRIALQLPGILPTILTQEVQYLARLQCTFAQRDERGVCE